MPRRRKSLIELSDTGRLGHDRKRFAGRMSEPADLRPLGDPPEHFDDTDRGIWFELERECGPGVLAKSDRMILELTTCLVRRSRLDRDRVSQTFNRVGIHLLAFGMAEDEVEEFKESMLKDLRPTAGETRVLMSCLSSMGLTPLSRC